MEKQTNNKKKPQWIYIKLFLDNNNIGEIRALVIPDLDHTIIYNDKPYKIVDVIHIFGVGHWDTPYQEIKMIVETI